MNKIVLILKHEFIHMVRTKSFVILTLAFPTIALLGIGIYQIVQSAPPEQVGVLTIGYVDQAGGFDKYTSQSPEITLVSYATQEEADSALLDNEIREYIIIPQDYISHGVVTRYTLQKELEPADRTYRTIRDFLLSNLLEGQTSPEIAERAKVPVYLNSIRLDDTGEVATDQGGFRAFIVPFLFGILLLIAIFSSSGTLLQGLSEEKENRVMEILLSSVSTRQLLLGKVLGLGCAGLTQVVIWLLSTTFLLRMAETSIGGVFSGLQIPVNMLVLGITYFILGYLLFAVLMVGIGVIGTSARDSQQLSMLIIMPAIIPFYVQMIFTRENPDHIINTILTMIPITAPMAVFSRFAFGDIPVWEVALSITLLVISIIGAIFLAAKIFRTFALMHGKTPRIGEIINALRQT